jgi:CheY-like chemotaxis protein
MRHGAWSKSERLMYPDGEHILVVDDEPARREAIAAVLRAEGFPVAVANEGFAALRLMARREFRLLIAALDLPGMLDGMTTLRQARARQPGLRALLVAEHGALPPWRKPQLAEMIAVPFHRWELLGCVFELLHRDPALDALDLARRSRGALAS